MNKNIVSDKEVTLIEQLNQRDKERSTLLSLGNRIAKARNREDLWHVFTAQILDLFNGNYYTICLINEDGQTHSPFLHTQSDRLISEQSGNPIIHIHHPIEDGIFNLALSNDQPIIIDLEEFLKQNKASVPAYVLKWTKLGIKEMMMVKITNGDEVRGILYLYAENSGSFEECQFNLLSGVADQLGTGICNVLANEKIERQLAEINIYKQQLEEENHYLQEENKLTGRFSEIIGKSPELQKVFRLVSHVAPSNSTALLLGETGTGKELFARAIHNASPRKDKLMIKVNCAAMPASLIESELFGHEKGSFTGAMERRIGKFELAQNSTLFLDEIGELPLELQVKLLRVLQEKEIERIGGKTTIKVNVRIIAASNRNLEKEVKEGRFRNDLYYRLNVFPIHLPSLRKRKEDIPLLASHFIEQYARSTGKKNLNISNKAMEDLVQYSWPGNVRELEHLIERTVLLTSGTIIRHIHLPVQSSNEALAAEEFTIRSLEDIEREYILKVVKLCKGRISGINGAAAKLNLPHTTLISKMNKLGIRKDHFIESIEGKV
ncbi:MAG: sigma 54-interacting transcriptional regulator [Sporocytophaga sp.]|uniref:sigma-54-dependent Fis family transcriptional regulator n=1 Tax=Sporocytophaga sp. TaxID=2231183 RepID=UPI001B1F5E2D|nr:sigma 54-interacting transcriptional regulator [Sporocytophaga sp.]MBO9701885.1 sigma 54-interacting transcriptional regulator [Sporocytophaga sp.]